MRRVWKGEGREGRKEDRKKNRKRRSEGGTNGRERILEAKE